jgi:hypothetical protein
MNRGFTVYYTFFFAEALKIGNIYHDMPCLSTVERKAEYLSKVEHFFITAALFMVHSMMFPWICVGRTDLIIW